MNIERPDMPILLINDPGVRDAPSLAAILERDGSKTHPTEQPERIPKRDELVPITLKGNTYHIPYWVYLEVTNQNLTRAERQMKKKGLLQSIKSARIPATPKGVTL